MNRLACKIYTNAVGVDNLGAPTRVRRFSPIQHRGSILQGDFAKCKRCGTSYITKLKPTKPFKDKRNFRRSDPLYAQYQRALADTYGLSNPA